MKTLKLISMFALSAALLSASCGPDPATVGSLTFVHEYEGQMVFVLGGEGEATIDWGDGSAPQTVTLTPFEDRESHHDITHTYTEGSGTKSVTVTGRVTGIDIGGIDSHYRVTSLDAGAMPMLQYLECMGTQLTSLDVGGLAELKELVVSLNRITSLDLTGCPSLTVLNCAGNALTSLDVAGCSSLTVLHCNGNALTSLNVAGLASLTELGCAENTLASLDLTGCTSLTELYCVQSTLTSLVLTGCTALRSVDISGNLLEADAIRAVFAALPDRTGDTEPATITCDPDDIYEDFYGPPNPGWASITEGDRKVAADKNWRLNGYAAPR